MTQNSVVPTKQTTDAILLGRIWNPAVSGPSVITIRGDDVIQCLTKARELLCGQTILGDDKTVLAVVFDFLRLHRFHAWGD